LWTGKYTKYKEMGKKRKSDYYLRLLLLNPPMPPGHKVLKGYVQALTEEYKNDASGDDWTGMWLGTVPDEDFEEAGTSKEFFKKWFDVTESMVAEKQVSISELKGHWGLVEAAPPPAEPVYPDPAPIGAYTPIGEPVPPMHMPIATGYGTNYPEAGGYPPAMPAGIPMAQPAMPMAQPVPMAQPPLYGGPAPQMYGQTTTTTTTTQYTNTMMGQPQVLGYGQPSGMYATMPPMGGGYPGAAPMGGYPGAAPMGYPGGYGRSF